MQCREKWSLALGKLKALHMKTLRWKNTKRVKSLLDVLGPIPHDCGLIPVWTRLRVSDYSDLIDDTSVSRKLGHGYYVSAQFLGLMLLQFARVAKQRVKIVFERNEQFAPILPSILKLYGQLFNFVSGGLPLLSGVEIVDKSSTCLTQPADYLTYARLQELRNPRSIKAKLCAPILSPQPGIRVEVGRQSIRQLMSSDTTKDLWAMGRRLEPFIKRVREAQKRNEQQL